MYVRTYIKISIRIIIHKHYPNNYRPLLGSISKVMVWLINSAILKLVLKHKMTSDNQLGFPAGHSTADAAIGSRNWVNTRQLLSQLSPFRTLCSASPKHQSSQPWILVDCTVALGPTRLHRGLGYAFMLQGSSESFQTTKVMWFGRSPRPFRVSWSRCMHCRLVTRI